MKTTIKTLIMVILSPIYLLAAGPTVIIDTWTNHTNKELVIYTINPDHIVPRTDLGTVHPGGSITLNKEIEPITPYGGLQFNLYTADTSNPDASMLIAGKMNTQLQRIDFKAYSSLIELPANQQVAETSKVFGKGEDTNTAVVHLNVESAGNHFENTKLRTFKTGTSKSMREQAVERVAKLVKARTITLEKAKSMLPPDLHEELEAQSYTLQQ